MTARDELARAIFLADNVNAPAGLMESEWDSNKGDETYAHTIADGLLAAGYRKPRTITTIEELDALPEWSVIRSEQATIWEKFKGGYGSDFWAETMTLGKHPSSHIALPATVLHEGTQP